MSTTETSSIEERTFHLPHDYVFDSKNMNRKRFAGGESNQYQAV
ncbi:MAG: hypothetical protein ACM34O_06545 [Ignavibacteria bacterium]